MISPVTFLAMASSPGGEGGQQSPMFMIVWLGIMIAIFYMMLIRPQQRREKSRRALIDSVKSGDRVMFAGGILGHVTNVKDRVLTVKIADGVKIEVTRSAVSHVLEKGETPSDEPAR
jgi:preprotein translocase subunit YajC